MILLLVLLLLLIVRLLCLLTRLFHELFQLFDLLFQLLGLLAVGEEDLLVADDGRVARGGPHAFAVKFLGPVQLGQRLADCLFGGIEVLRLKLFRCALQTGTRVEVGDHADVLIGRGAHERFLFGRGDGAFVERPSFFVVLFDLLLFESAVVQLGRRFDGFRRGLFRFLFCGFRRGLRLLNLSGRRCCLRAGFARRGDEQKRGERKHGLNGARTRFGDAEKDREQDDRGGERIGGAFDGTERGDGVFALLAVELPDARFEFVDAAVRGGGADVDAARAAGEFGQLGLVERAFDRISLAIGENAELAVLVRDADDRRVRGVADADREDGDLRLGEVVDDRCAASGEFVAVGHEDDGLVRALRAFERLDGFFERELDVGAADRDRVGVEVVHELDEARPVHGQRADQKGFARERDEAEPVARILLHDLAHEPFRVVHATRLHVVGEHAFRDVEQDQQVASGGDIVHDLFAPGRTGGGDGQEQNGEREQDDAEDAFAGRRVGKTADAFVRAEHFAQKSVPADAAGDGENEDQRDDPE